MMGVSGGFVFATNGAHRHNPLDLYSLFRRPLDSPDGHLALKGIRCPDDGLYAKPFRTTGVDYRLLPDGTGGMTEALGADGLIVSFEKEAFGPLLVYGFAADHIVAVEVVVAGNIVSARLENNAFAALADAEANELEGVAFHRADGTSTRV